ERLLVAFDGLRDGVPTTLKDEADNRAERLRERYLPRSLDRVTATGSYLDRDGSGHVEGRKRLLPGQRSKVRHVDVPGNTLHLAERAKVRRRRRRRHPLEVRNDDLHRSRV